ncbi:hypothetical protein CSUI_003264 [Cystoisospora suis]|uniref:Transmembrane protein n=1 Tax=Cystoisospora suis TaxID=483139 RepID=A0A2C6L5N3_9APIC|nr:hypothetical protein CSUI_003264 [Cystoisospora suis]
MLFLSFVIFLSALSFFLLRLPLIKHLYPFIINSYSSPTYVRILAMINSIFSTRLRPPLDKILPVPLYIYIYVYIYIYMYTLLSASLLGGGFRQGSRP